MTHRQWTLFLTSFNEAYVFSFNNHTNTLDSPALVLARLTSLSQFENPVNMHRGWQAWHRTDGKGANHEMVEWKLEE